MYDERDSSFINLLIDNLPHCIFWKDKNLVFRGCNKQYALQFGYESPKDIVGKTDGDLPSTPFLRNKYIQDDKKIIASGKAKINYEEEQKQPDGSIKIVLVSKVPVYDKSGKILGVLGIYTDITDRKKTEILKKEKENAEKVAHFMQLLAGSIAHELRAPLRNISASVFGLKKHLATLIKAYELAKQAKLNVEPISKNDRKILANIPDEIESETQAAFTAIDMLLVKSGMSCLDLGNFKTCSVSACINEALQRYPFDYGEREEIIWPSEKSLADFEFYGKQILMVHILFNLLKNSLYYLRAANKGKISIWLEHGEHSNLLHFKDTGAGIDAKTLPHIFDRFFTRTLHGTGIGLSFSKMVMQSFGGNITCQSVEHEFTEFILKFPLPVVMVDKA